MLESTDGVKVALSVMFLPWGRAHGSAGHGSTSTVVRVPWTPCDLHPENLTDTAEMLETAITKIVRYLIMVNLFGGYRHNGIKTNDGETRTGKDPSRVKENDS